MRFFLFVLVLIFVAGCSTPEKKVAPKKAVKKTVVSYVDEDKKLKKILKQKFSKKGKFSAVTDENVTTEKYRRDDSETILLLEKGELRTETLVEEKRTITRTWQNDEVTGLTVSTPKKTTMVTLDRDGNFTQKIITEVGKKKAVCVTYEGKMAVAVEDESCTETLSGFE